MTVWPNFDIVPALNCISLRPYPLRPLTHRGGGEAGQTFQARCLRAWRAIVLYGGEWVNPVIDTGRQSVGRTPAHGLLTSPDGSAAHRDNCA